MEINQHTNIDIKASCDTSQLTADQQVVWGGYVLCEDRVGGRAETLTSSPPPHLVSFFSFLFFFSLHPAKSEAPLRRQNGWLLLLH